MSMGKPITLNYLFFLCPQSFNSSRRTIEVVNSLGRARHGSLILCLSKYTIWGSRILASTASKHMNACQSFFPSVEGRFCCSSTFNGGQLVNGCVVHSPKSQTSGFVAFFCVTVWYGTLIVVLQQYPEIQSSMRPCFSVLQSEALCCCVSLWFVVMCTLVGSELYARLRSGRDEEWA